MATPGIHTRGFATSAELQDFLLTLEPGGLVVVPHLRLAYQVWRRQRLAARSQGRAAWEPLALTTLSGWWQQLWHQAWLPCQPSTLWQRLVLWLEVLEALPFQGQSLAELSWAILLDESFDLIHRYQLPPPDSTILASPFIVWRQSVFENFTAQAAGQGIGVGAHIPLMLLKALNEGKLKLPDYLVVVGLETLAPLEEQWLQAVAQQRPLLRVHVWGRQDHDLQRQAVALPDQRQEMEWVAARLLDLAQKMPLHRLAVTAANLEDYLPAWRRLMRELLGPAVTAGGGRYNFSLGPTLADSALFQAALLPLRFVLGGEKRQDLMAWLQSPYYGVWRDGHKTVFSWDRNWRQHNLSYGWPALKKAGPTADRPETGEHLAALIDQALNLLPTEPAALARWQDCLTRLWSLLAFPVLADRAEEEAWRRLQGLLHDLAVAGGHRPWSAAALLEWLEWGSARQDLPGDGTSEAGIQIHGLLELRGLDYDVVFCLGLDMGLFPPPPRNLPLLTVQERAAVWGGTYISQHQFAEISYRYLQAAAPQLILTRPLVWQDEEQLASPLIAATVAEENVTFAALSHLDAGWLRSPAVRAAFRHPESQPDPLPEECLTLPLPVHISLTALERALACPSQFFYNDLLEIEPLPEEESGLTPLMRGQIVHEIVYLFTKRYGAVVADIGAWHDQRALELLQEVVTEVAGAHADDPHWQAEVARWLEGEGGLLRRWLALEKDRYQEGWRWLAQEQKFGGLRLPGWPTLIQGRIDRLDRHPTAGVILWDYKTGDILSKRALLEERRHFQLVGYLAAVQQKCLRLPGRQALRAGIIGLKSSRSDHLKFEDFKLTAADWEALLDQKVQTLGEVGKSLEKGIFHPDPSPPPPARNSACQYCPYALLCWYEPPAAGEETS